MSVKGAVNEATQTRAVEWIARAGYPVSGILHLLIAYLIVRIALGFGGDADQTGALATLASSGGGALPLWIVAAGLIALAMWRFAEAVLGLHPAESTAAHHRESPISDRLKAFGLGLVYCAVAFMAIQFALNVARWGKGTTAGLSARLMQSGGGKTLLVIVGFVIAAIGAYYVHKGATQEVPPRPDGSGRAADHRAGCLRSCRRGVGAVRGRLVGDRGDIRERSG